jgi:chromosomal replication initiator protein
MTPRRAVNGDTAVEFDPRLTFETFVVGPANRLASAAARRAAESPGASYNPLFLYSASGLGKSHILNAIAHHAVRTSASRVVEYETLEGYLDHLAEVLEAGGSGAALERYAQAEILLLDDVQFLTGQAQAQEMLLRTLDTLTTRGAQVVLASDRPPAEINGLDARLLSRFSGGLIVDIGLPDYETRVAIMRRKAEDRKARLAEGVAETLARFPFQNVRELQGALNRLLAVQELEERLVPVEDLGGVLGPQFAAAPPTVEEPGSGGGAVEGGADEELVEPEWRVAFSQIIQAVESAGYSADRLRRQLDDRWNEPAQWKEMLQAFRNDIDRLREIRRELQDLPAPWPSDADVILRDPDLLDEAERLLGLAVERSRPFPIIPPGPTLEAAGARFPALARRAAERAMTSETPEYNPLFVHASDPIRTRDFLEASGRTCRALDARARIGLLSVSQFSEEFIAALSAGVAGAWRERWWSVDLLLLCEVEALGRTERAQEEFFHLFEALKRKGARIFVAADRPASMLEGIDDRLRSRFQGGLVLDLGQEPGAREPAAPPVHFPGGGPFRETPAPPARPPAPGTTSPPRTAPLPSPGAATASSSELVASAGIPAGAREEPPVWTPPWDRVVWRWPRIEDRIVEDAS